MSNKRIDLTQFEHDSNNPPEEIECAECGRTIGSEDGDNFFACHRCGWSGYPSDSQAILMVDELVAELKRCYEEIDRLNGSLYVYCEVCKEFYIHGCEHASE